MTNRKNDVKFHEVLKQASIYVYGKGQLPAGYRVVDWAENKENGFYAEAISNGKDVIIAIRGTEFNTKEDLNTDWNMTRHKYLNQAGDALDFHDKIKHNYPNIDVSVTGHSLGGTLSQVISSIRGTFTVTFNAYGARDLFKTGEVLKESNIVNYVNEWDPITIVNGENLIGDIYAIKGNFGHIAHFIEDFEPLSNREYRTIEDMRKHKNLINRVGNKSIYTKKQIKNTTNQVVNKAKQTIHNVSQCVGSYPVSGYTREDGIEVKGYIRRCGAKHNN